MKIYRLGLIGLGPWGQNYISLINQMPNIELIYAVRKTNIRPDFLPTNCTFLSEQQSNKFYKFGEGLDGVIVSTGQPYDPTMTCLMRNIPVMAEKPLLTSSKQINLLNEFGSNKKLLVNYIHLFSNPFQELKKIVANNKIIRICSSGFGPSKTREHFSSLWDYGTHDVSMILSLMKTEATEVDIQTHNKTKSGHLFIINLSFNGIRTKSIVGNGSMVKSRYFSVVYEDNGQENCITYDDLSQSKLFLNGKPLILQNTQTPLKNSIIGFLNLIDGKYDDRQGTDLTVKITRILSSYQQQ